MVSQETTEKFMRLLRGRTDAYGTGEGRWIKRPLNGWQYKDHLEGKGFGLGVAPLMDDGRVWFAAVDLDEPDFDAAMELLRFLHFAGQPWIERSRSGNAHVWCFFDKPIEAWIPRGIMREATKVVGKPSVEIFPKQDKLQEGMVGNYINLMYHGDSRPILYKDRDGGSLLPLARDRFLEVATTQELCSADGWMKRAQWLMLSAPEQRDSEIEFGTGKELHCCASWIVANRDENPVREGHRNVVYFNLAKMLAHYEGIGHGEALAWMKLVRDSATQQGEDRYPDRELERNLHNAERGGFTSTGCDDPLMQPYTDPSCKIGH